MAKPQAISCTMWVTLWRVILEVNQGEGCAEHGGRDFIKLFVGYMAGMIYFNTIVKSVAIFDIN